MIKKIDEENLRVAIIGLGYVGLPTALSFHDAGFNVAGIDTSKKVLDLLKKGKNHLIEENSNIEIPINSKRWITTNDYEKIIPSADLILITVPTPITDNLKPNLSFVESSCRSVLKNITKKQSTVILESTVYPGVTREILGRISNELNLVPGTDFQFGYSPERVSPGDLGRSSSEVAKIVGTDDIELGEWLSKIYGLITSGGCTYVGSPEVAEAAKLIENTQRDIDIAFANELAVVLPRMGLDVEDVLEAASTKWNFHRHKPGLGIGGHCIPVDPYFYIEMSDKLGFKSIVSTAARKMNKEIENIASEEIMNIMDKYELKKALFLGYSYKPNVGDVRETPIEKICEKIKNQGGKKTIIWDPLVDNKEVPNWIDVIDDLDEIPKDVMIIIGTAHDMIVDLDFSYLKNKLDKPVIYDGRRILKLDKLENDGWSTFAIGKPSN